MRLSSAASVLLATLIAPHAHAKTVYKSGNWALDDLSLDPVPQNACAMVQEATIGRTKWRLEITHAKNSVGVTEILLKQTGGSTKSWSLQTQTGETLVFASAGPVGSTEVLWHIPQKTAALIQHWDARKDIQMIPADGSRGGFKLFDSGFGQVKEKMVERCLGSIPLVDVAFEAAFLKRTGLLNPNLVSVETVARLRALLPEAHQVFLQVGANTRELQALRTQFAAPLQEAQQLTATITRLKETDIPALELAQQNNEALEVSAKAELQRLLALIPTRERAVAQAQEVRDRTYNVIAPYLDEHEALSDAVDSAERQITSGEARLREIDSSASSAQSRLRSLSSELTSVQSALRQNEQSLRQAESEFRRAESEFRNFNPASELRRRLQSDFSYQNAVRDLERIERESRQAHSEWKRDVADRETKERALRACQARGPETDCSAEQGAWKVAVAQAERSESAYRRFENQLSSLRSRVQSAENSVEREVERERNLLGDRMAQTERRRDQFAIAVSEGQAREREISAHELPRLRDQLSALERERPLVVDQVSRARSDLARANSALASFEARVGWDAKLSAYQSAAGALDARQSELSSANRAKLAAERNIQTAQSQRPLIAQQLADQRLALVKAETRLQEVRVVLEAFETERVRIETIGSELSGRLTALSSEFADQLPQ